MINGEYERLVSDGAEIAGNCTRLLCGLIIVKNRHSFLRFPAPIRSVDPPTTILALAIKSHTLSLSLLLCSFAQCRLLLLYLPMLLLCVQSLSLFFLFHVVYPLVTTPICIDSGSSSPFVASFRAVNGTGPLVFT